MTINDLDTIRRQMHEATSQAQRNAIYLAYEAAVEALPLDAADELFDFVDELAFLVVAFSSKVRVQYAADLARQEDLGFAPKNEAAFRRGYFRRVAHQNPSGLDRFHGTDADRSEAHGEFVAKARSITDLMERAAVEFYGFDEEARKAFRSGWNQAAAGKTRAKVVSNRVDRARRKGHEAFTIYTGV